MNFYFFEKAIDKQRFQFLQNFLQVWVLIHETEEVHQDETETEDVHQDVLLTSTMVVDTDWITVVN